MRDPATKHPRIRFELRARALLSMTLAIIILCSLPFSAVSQASSLTTSEHLKLDPALLVNINSGPKPDSGNFKLPDGFKIEPILWNVSLPSSITFDEKGDVFVAEAGYAPGGLESSTRILKIDENGTISTLTDRSLYPPITDIQYHQGKIFVANRGKMSVVDAETGKTSDIITGLRNLGDYRTGQIAFGPNGRIYFGQGAATNSGVVGEDNYEWLSTMPTFYGVAPFYDVPGHNITLTGQNFKSSNIFTPVDPKDSASTGAFVPFGNSTHPDQNVKGDVRCTACVVSAKPDGTDIRVEAWGIRNPSGLVYDNSTNSLIVSSTGANERGSRPIANDSDKIFAIRIAGNNSSSGNTSPPFLGWPDYFGNGEPATLSKFHSKLARQPMEFLMANHPQVQKPLALLKESSQLNQMAISNNTNFGFVGKAFAAEFGQAGVSDFGAVGVPAPGGDSRSNLSSDNASNSIAGTSPEKTAEQKVVMFDPKTLTFADFLTLKNPDLGFRPVGLRFTNDGSALYVISVGKVEVRSTNPHGFALPSAMPWYYKHTGVVWRITNANATGGIDQGLAGKKQVKPEDVHLSEQMKKTQINSGDLPTDPQTLYVHPGYKIEPVLWNIDKPGSFAFDDKGNTYIASTGITYGKQTDTPTIYKLDTNGTLSILADRPLHGILSDIEYNKNNGLLYVAHRNIISTVNVTSGIVKDLVNGLPTSAYVTHPMGQLAFGPDGRLFFNVGGLSNLAVPDVSDYGIGWIAEMPFMHEVPPIDIHLNGINFESSNFLTAEPNDKAVTGGFMPFATPAYDGQLVKGDLKCTACIFSIKPDGSDLRLHAWGVRSAYGMAFDDKGRLYWSNNGNDDKGVRRVTADIDSVSVLDARKQNLTFFGWPEFMGMGEPITAKKFNQSPVQHYANVLMVRAKDLPPVTEPLVDLKAAVAATQVVFSANDAFGYKGKMFLGEFGTSAPVQHVSQIPKEMAAGIVMGQLVGQKVVIFDPDTGTIENFITPSVADASFRPVGLQFSPDGKDLYVASLEVHEVRKVTPTGAILPTHEEWPYAMTGVIWKVSHTEAGK